MAEFDGDKIAQAHQEILDVINKYNLSVGEITILYGNLGYTLGASIGGYKEKGPSIEELKKLYYTNPGLAVAMMLNGITVTTWYEDIDKQKEKGEDHGHT